MERLADGTIVAAPADDLCELAASLQPGETLAISPGVYKIERCIVVDKDVTIKSATENARDVTIVRSGASALLVKGGAPSIENLTFITTEASDYGVSSDEIALRNCVTILGGSPTLIGCRATSAEGSGYAVRGEKTSARLARCEAKLARNCGAFFDEGASGVVEDCLFADTGLGCFDVEQTSAGKWVDVVRTKLCRSDFAPLSIHNGGRVRATDCDVSSQRPYGFVVHADNGVFEARSCRFYNRTPLPEGTTFDSLGEIKKSANAFAVGVRANNSKIAFEDSVFEQVVAAFANTEAPSALTMTRCKTVDCAESVLIDPDSPDPVFNDCLFEKEPVVCGDFDYLYFTREHSDDEDFDDEDSDDKEFDDEDLLGSDESDAVYERAEHTIEELVGPAVPKVVKNSEYDILGFLHPNSRFGGTFVLTRRMYRPAGPYAADSPFRSFELAMATRAVNLKACGVKEEKPFGDNSKSESIFKNDSIDANSFKAKIADMVAVIGLMGYYIECGNAFERYDIFRIPEDFEDSSLAGRCFLFDALAPKKETDSEVDPAKYFDYDLDTIPERLNSDKQEEYGLILIIELTPEEFALAEREGGVYLMPLFKEAKCWPFSDLNREQCLGH